MTKLIVAFHNFVNMPNNLNATKNWPILCTSVIHSLSRYGKNRLRLFELDTEEYIWSEGEGSDRR